MLVDTLLDIFNMLSSCVLYYLNSGNIDILLLHMLLSVFLLISLALWAIGHRLIGVIDFQNINDNHQYVPVAIHGMVFNIVTIDYGCLPISRYEVVYWKY
jgi:hypothetical protein